MPFLKSGGEPFQVTCQLASCMVKCMVTHAQGYLAGNFQKFSPLNFKSGIFGILMKKSGHWAKNLFLLKASK